MLAFFLFGGAVVQAKPSLHTHLHLDQLHEAAPELIFETESGHKSLADFKGSNLILHFWASWCGPCKIELPRLMRLSSEFTGKDVPRFLFVAAEEKDDHQDAQRFLDKLEVKVPLWTLVESADSKKYIGWGLPVTYFINTSGQVVARAVGQQEWEKVLPAEIQAIFNKGKSH